MYTSRLPISTSVRRPTSHGEGGSTSFAGLHRPSNIPVTVRKANLFTPQTKRPLLSGASTAGKSYSSITGTATGGKYQRMAKPMPEKDEQMRMFNTLVEFMKLHSAGAPLQLPEAKKFFSSISTTESSRIFEFLISRILPDFKIQRLETDVPDALSRLKYPHIRSVTKSALVSVTSRNGAVALLVIFDWLIALINKMNEVGQESLNEPVDEDGEIFKNIRLQPERLVEANRELFERLYPTCDVQSRELELDEITEEIERISEKIRENEEEFQAVQTLDEDIQKCCEYGTQMQKYIKTKQIAEADIRHEISKLDIMLEKLQERNKELSAQIKGHELSPDEVVRNQTVIDKLERERDEISKALKAAQNEERKYNQDYQDLLGSTRERIRKDISLMKNLLSIYDSQLDLYGSQIDEESIIANTTENTRLPYLSERRREIREWIIKLEQMSPDDISQIQKLQHELSLYIQKLHATNPTLESELMSALSDKEMELNEYRANDERLIKEGERLRLSIDRIKRETEDEKSRLQIDISEIKMQIEDEDRKAVNLKEKHDKKKAEAIKELEDEFNGLELKRRELAETENLCMENLKSVLARNKQKAMSLVKESEQDAAQWLKIQSICGENNQVAKTAVRMFKKIAIN